MSDFQNCDHFNNNEIYITTSILLKEVNLPIPIKSKVIMSIEEMWFWTGAPNIRV